MLKQFKVQVWEQLQGRGIPRPKPFSAMGEGRIKMKKLIDYQEEIHKCSKCGLCQSVCPVYEQTGNDCSVSRGKFIMLNGIIKGDLKLNKNVNKYLDMCLKCNACKNFCPSGIDARKIFLTAKAQYFQKCPSSVLIKAFQSKFMFNFVLNMIKIASNTYRFLQLEKILKKFYPILFKMGWVGKKAILANEFLSTPHPNPLSQVGRENFSPLTVIYFKGCVNEYINPRVKIATENVLNKMGVEILPANFECCGVPFLSCGNVEQFKNQAEFNLAQIPDDFDYFLTDCASCQNAFEEYKNYIDDAKLIEKLDKILEKSINVNEFIVKNIKNIEYSEKVSFTFHKPCHLDSVGFIKEFLTKSKNVEYIEMKDFDKCCGFSGEFAIKNSTLSQQISAKKVQNAIATNADYILTSCPACLLGLTQGQIEQQVKSSHFSLLTSHPLNFVEFVELGEFKLKSDYENEDCDKKLLDAFVKNCF